MLKIKDGKKSNFFIRSTFAPIQSI